MELVEIDVIRAEAAQAVVNLLQNACGATIGHNAAAYLFQASLRRDIEIFAATMLGHRFAHDFFCATHAVDCSSVDQIDAVVKDAATGVDGFAFIHRTPLAAANGPGAQCDARDAHSI